MSYRRRLYHTIADDSTDIPTHITELREVKDQLAIMDNNITDLEFVIVLISSLPESWDSFTSAHLGNNNLSAIATSSTMASTSTSIAPTVISSFELIALILDEDHRRKEKSGEAVGGSSAMFARNSKHTHKHNESDPSCYNCGKRGHMAKDCWAKGGGMEGKGPRGKGKGKGKKDDKHSANVNTHQSSNDKSHHQSAFTASETSHFDACLSRDTWLADSGTTTHIANNRDFFRTFEPIRGETITGLGDNKIEATGRGTVVLENYIDGQKVTSELHNTLYAPAAVNNLLSISRVDDAAGSVTFENGKVLVKSKLGHVMIEGKKKYRLYWLNAHAQKAAHTTHVATQPVEDTWDVWHRKYGHISKSTLELLVKEGGVEGLTIDPNSAQVENCEACIQAKAHRASFPKESGPKSKNPREGTHSDL